MLFTHGSSQLDYIDIPLGDISFFHSARPVYLPYMMRDQLSGLLMNHHVGDACTNSMIAEIWVIETTMSAHYHRSSLLNGKNKVDMALHITFAWFSHQCNTRYTVNRWCHRLIGLLITLSCLPVMNIISQEYHWYAQWHAIVYCFFKMQKVHIECQHIHWRFTIASKHKDGNKYHCCPKPELWV